MRLKDKLKNAIKRTIFEVKSKFISLEDRETIDKFHKLYYNLGIVQFTEWRGHKIYKYPNDLFLYSEIIFKNKPDVIIETGTLFGGSSLFFADILELIGNGKVITIDTVERDFQKHERIHYITNSSLNSELLNSLEEECKGKKVMVILDSDHHKEHVLNELKAYSKLVSLGQYLIVEDGDINGHPVYENFGEGPYEAIEEFMKHHHDFKIDKKVEEKFLFTASVNGFLRRII